MHLKLGYHFITVQAWDYQGKIDLTGSIVQVVNTVDCPLPGSPGVHICTPADGLTFAQKTLTISASAAAPSPIKVMELWIDGSKRQVWLGVNQINYTAELSPGVHSISVWAIDQNNQKYNQTVTATIEATD
jgi:hypothetical protein